MTTILDSYDALRTAAVNNGLLIRGVQSGAPFSTTAATATCGSVSGGRQPNNVFTVPTMTGVTDAYCVSGGLLPSGLCMVELCLETLLGTCTANGGTGTFVDGGTPPTRLIRGVSQQVYEKTVAVVSTTMVGAGTYTLTITYTNESGTGSRTATLTLPNVSAVNTAFLVDPHLQAGDTGISDITGITLSGTSGVVKIYSLVSLLEGGGGVGGPTPSPLTTKTMCSVNAGDTLTFYRWMTTNVSFNGWFALAA